MAEIQWQRYPLLSQNHLARKQLTIEAALGHARNTIDAYARGREDFFVFCATHNVAPELAGKEIASLWVRDLLSRPRRIRNNAAESQLCSGLANATVQQRATSVRLYFDFVIEQGRRRDNPVGRGRYAASSRCMTIHRRGLVPRYQKLPWIPSDEQMTTILEAMRSEPLRNRLMFCLAYDAALRREELCTLHIDDFDFAHRLLRIRSEVAKGRRERIVPYSSSSATLLSTYLCFRRALSIRPGALFLSESRRNRCNPLTIWTWSKTVNRIARHTGVTRFTTHTLRHLCLTDLARSGWDIHDIATFAGHKSIEATKIYIHLTGRDLAEKIRRGMDQIHRWRTELIEAGLR